VECIGCLEGKAKRLASHENNKRAEKPLVNVSVDLWGPSSVPSRKGYYYFLTCYDDHSKYVHVTPLKNKSDAANALRNYASLAENQLDRTIKTIRSDQGGKFTSNAHKAWALDKGIKMIYTPTAAHNQNARVERMHLTLMNNVRTNLADSWLALPFWVDALRHAVYTRNRIPDNAGTTPYSRFMPNLGNKGVDYKHFKAFGDQCIYRIAQAQSKLAPRGRKGRIIGYGQGTTSYTILDEELRKVVVSRDVTSVNGHQLIGTPDPVKHNGIEDNSPKLGEELQERLEPSINEDDKPNVDEDHNEIGQANGDDAISDPEPRVHQDGPEREHRFWRVEFNREDNPSPESNQEDNDNNNDNGLDQQDEEDNNQPRRSTRLQGGAPSHQPLHEIDTVTRYIAEHALSTQEVNNPQNYNKARNSPHWPQWKEAMDKDLGKMDKYSVWEQQAHTGQWTLSGKWLYTCKIDGETGKPCQFKACHRSVGMARYSNAPSRHSPRFGKT
jgi:hypothetical protein